MKPWIFLLAVFSALSGMSAFADQDAPAMVCKNGTATLSLRLRDGVFTYQDNRGSENTIHVGGAVECHASIDRSNTKYIDCRTDGAKVSLEHPDASIAPVSDYSVWIQFSLPRDRSEEVEEEIYGPMVSFSLRKSNEFPLLRMLDCGLFPETSASTASKEIQKLFESLMLRTG